MTHAAWWPLIGLFSPSTAWRRSCPRGDFRAHGTKEARSDRSRFQLRKNQATSMPMPSPSAVSTVPASSSRSAEDWETGAEIRADLERVLDDGIRQLHAVERSLALQPAYWNDLRDRLLKAHEGSLNGGRTTADLDRHVGVMGRSEGRPTGEVLVAYLWPQAREAWRESLASLIAAKRVLSEDGEEDAQAVGLLQEAVDRHLAAAKLLGDENPWAIPGRDEDERRRCVSGMHATDVHVVNYLASLGPSKELRAVGHEAAEEIREKALQRWTAWRNTQAESSGQAPAPWRRWRNRALFPTILARVLWRGEVRDRAARLRVKPPGTIYAVFRSIARVSSQQLELGLDDRGRRAVLRRDGPSATVVADVPAVNEEIFAQGLALLGSRYTLPTVEWLIERAHRQTLQGVDRPDVVEIEGGWEAFTRLVLEKPSIHPRERAIIRSLSRTLACTPIRWQDGARSSSLFMVSESAITAGRGRGRSVIRFTLDNRLLAHEHHRARERFGGGAGPAQWADWRIVPLPRPRNMIPLPGSPRDTYGPQAVVLRLLWLFFTRNGDQLLQRPRLVQIAPHERRLIAEEAQLPSRLMDSLLGHFVHQGAIIAGPGSRYAPSDRAARAFIADGWRRSRSASELGRRAAQANVCTQLRGPMVPG